jgi:hypothetical protein
MNTLKVLTVSTIVIAQTSFGQIVQLEQKESRAFLGIQNRGYGPRDYYKYTGTTNKVILESGRKITIIDLYCRVFHTCSISIDVMYGASPEKYTIFCTGLLADSIYPQQSPVGKTIIGPAAIDLTYIPATEERATSVGYNIELDNSFSTGTALWRYEINNYETETQSTTTPVVSSASVVVPSSAVGDVDVLLEQSNDMITWTQCLPGTYNASTQKRFFRVRAVEK